MRPASPTARFIAGLLWLGFLGCLAGLIGSQFGKIIEQADSFSHFQHYYALGFAIASVVSLLLRRVVLSVISGLSFVGAVLLFGPASPLQSLDSLSQTGTKPLTITTFNTRYDNTNINAISSYIENNDPDVIFFQEISKYNEGILELLTDYPYRQRCETNTVMSVMILSKTAASDQGCFEFSYLGWMELTHEGITYRAISAHIHWPWPFAQWRQVRELSFDVAAWEHANPIIIAGDFNAVPWSASVSEISRYSRTSPTPGFRITLKKPIRPLKIPLWAPIDHVLLPNSVKPITAKAGPYIGSDHRPVTVVVQFDSATKKEDD